MKCLRGQCTPYLRTVDSLSDGGRRGFVLAFQCVRDRKGGYCARVFLQRPQEIVQCFLAEKGSRCIMNEDGLRIVICKRAETIKNRVLSCCAAQNGREYPLICRDTRMVKLEIVGVNDDLD